jgi:hypothetical protein
MILNTKGEKLTFAVCLLSTIRPPQSYQVGVVLFYIRAFSTHNYISVEPTRTPHDSRTCKVKDRFNF